jgi:hypothetical protein
MLMPETVLQSRYRVIRLLGQGGMGAVYEAMDERLDTTVALKETLFADERLRKQFEREARLLARMHHPALPRVSDHFAEGEGQFLVMQFIPGDDLSQMMVGKQGPFPPHQVLTWGDQLLDALDYLHTQDPQIIHRDIKPQNLKLTGRGQIILLDFGLAKGQAGGVSMVTTSASIFGYTPNYAPLEQIQGLGTDARSDIYALSATLYHLMTAVRPPDALTRAAAIVNGQPDPLTAANEISGAIGPEVASVLARAMSQNREQRYPTAAAMRDALKGTEEAATLSGRSEAATVLLAPVVATHANAPGAEPKPTILKGETTVVRSAVAEPKRRVWALGLGAIILIGVLFGGFFAFQRRNNSNTTAAPTNSPEQAAGAASSPAAEHGVTEPVVGGSNEMKKVIISNHSPAANETAKKSDKTVKGNDKSATTDPPSTPAQGEESFNPPVVPEIEIPDLSQPKRRGFPRMGGTTIKNLPDGTQVMTLPGGTRLVTMPDGSRRVFGVGPKVLRKKPKQ